MGANGDDSVGDGGGYELLVVRRGELREIGGGRSHLDGDGRGDNVIQGAEWRGESADGDLLLSQFRGYTGGYGLT